MDWLGVHLVRRILGLMSVAAIVFCSQMSSAQTDDELRALYFSKNFARMEELARAGDSRAEAWMGRIMHEQRRSDEAKEWYHRAAEKGSVWAIDMLARMYSAEKDLEEVARWYKRGAELGDGDMQVTLAWFYLQGRGVPRDDREAFRWYLAAAGNGRSYAYLATAEMYADGRGTVRNPVEAYAHVEIALKVLGTSQSQELERARALKQKIAQELSASEIEEACRRARERRPDIVKH